MSYSKLTDPVPGLATAIAAALAQARITAPVADAMAAAGAVVQLETGARVWVACIVHDRPETPQVDFLTVAIALQPDLTPWVKPNGQTVVAVWWHALWPDVLVSLGIDTVRRALMMIALGEPQPQIDIPNPDPDGPAQMDALPGDNPAAHSIRTVMRAATETTPPLADVL